MDDGSWAASEFENHRGHLRAVAYRMLGSLSDADDAVQEAWLRLARSSTDDVQNLRAWLTTVVARVCLDMLRSRTSRREDPLEIHLPDPIVSAVDDADPENAALVADSVGLALLVVLDTLSPTERLAFVLHDIFGVPFDHIGSMLDRSPAAAKQLASRARGRLRGADSATDIDRRRHGEVVDAFLAASREGDFAGLLAILDPSVILRADAGNGPLGPSHIIQGAEAVLRQAQRYAGLAQFARPVLVNGQRGLVAVRDGKPLSLLSIEVRDGKIVEINILADPERLNAVAALWPADR